MTGRLERLRPVAPLALVTGFAMYGQMSYGYANYSSAETPLVVRVTIAIGAAVAIESISLYVQWHAHDALLRKATATAARLRRASYFIALAIAGVNYSHFAHGWAPTPGAVVFAIFSASGPWLWGLHTRRVQRIQLLREGQADTSGAVFSAERFRNFPIRTWQARRWSIDYGVTDPRDAWEGYRAARARQAGQPTLAQKVGLLVTLTRLASTTPKPRQRRDDTTPGVADANPAPRTRGRGHKSAFLENPPAKAIELAQSGIGKVLLRKAVLDELGTEITHHEARQLIERHRPVNGHKVTTP